MTQPSTITVAAIQCAFTDDLGANVARVEQLVRDAAGRGAQLILPSELFEGLYFPQQQRETLFELAHPVDGHPTIARMGKILVAQPDAPDFLWWATIFGTNLGGNFTPIGSASTVVAVAVIHKHGLRLSFGQFVVKALPFAIAHLVLATAYVLLIVR